MPIFIYQPELLIEIGDDAPDETSATVDQPNGEFGIMATPRPQKPGGRPGVPRTIGLGSYTLFFDGRTWTRVHN